MKLTSDIPKITIVSNYINHHQIPLSNALHERLGDCFSFVQTERMEQDRVEMGWGAEVPGIPYLRLYYEDAAGCAACIMDSDIVIFGGVEDEAYIQPRLKAGKPVIRASERLYREGQWKSVSPRGRRKKYEDHTQYADSPVWLLCHGAYVASDFAIIKAYPNRKYVWGYFPEVNTYALDDLLARKRGQDAQGRAQIRILWAGRFLKLKHPEYAVKAARRLKAEGISFRLDMVGGGEQEDALKAMVRKYGLSDEVVFHGFRPPKEVRRFMEEARLFLFTSDYLEGWGAVLNEAMNSACAVVAGHGIGAVPFLLKHGKNGLVYRTGHFREFYAQVRQLCLDSALCERLGASAYETMISEWNPREAADRLYAFCQGIMEGKTVVQAHGPLSPAPLIAPREGYAYTRRNE
ncbi:MAG: glycosyltransferase family 4 protein [Roseburia sp.]|nr:glycosyltransferase family 4 protein [Roseburia sp.]